MARIVHTAESRRWTSPLTPLYSCCYSAGSRIDILRKMQKRNTILVWIVGLAIGIAAGALAALLLIPGMHDPAGGIAVHKSEQEVVINKIAPYRS